MIEKQADGRESVLTRVTQEDSRNPKDFEG